MVAKLSSSGSFAALRMTAEAFFLILSLPFSICCVEEWQTFYPLLHL
jgi:hypothetical protein